MEEERHPRHYIWGAHWRHLANTIEPPVCGGDAVLCQITLTTCYIGDQILCDFFDSLISQRIGTPKTPRVTDI